MQNDWKHPVLVAEATANGQVSIDTGHTTFSDFHFATTALDPRSFLWMVWFVVCGESCGHRVAA